MNRELALAQADVQSRDQLGPLSGFESGSQSEILSRGQHWSAGSEPRRGREASQKRIALHSGRDSIRLEHRFADRGDLLTSMVRRGLGKKRSEYLCAENSEDSDCSDQWRKPERFWNIGRSAEGTNSFSTIPRPESHSWISKAGFALACKKAGIDGVTWHTLRHTFASRLVNRGVDIVTVQQLLGHSTVTVTMRYTHTNLDSKRAAVAKLEGFSDNLVTVCTKMQQSSPNCHQMRPLRACCNAIIRNGGVGERLKPAVLKTVRLERVSGVRIPPPPPDPKSETKPGGRFSPYNP